MSEVISAFQVYLAPTERGVASVGPLPGTRHHVRDDGVLTIEDDKWGVIATFASGAWAYIRLLGAKEL